MIRDFICACGYQELDRIGADLDIICPECAETIYAEFAAPNLHFRGKSASRGAAMKLREENKEIKRHQKNIKAAMDKGYSGYSIKDSRGISTREFSENPKVLVPPKKVF